MLEKLQRFKVDIVALGIVALAVLREVYAALTTIDVADICGDDLSYLYGSSTNTNPEYSPLYVTWLDILEKAFGTPDALFVHQAIVFALFPLAFYSLLRFRWQSPFVAITTTLILLPSLVVRISGGCQPLVSAFAIVVGLLWIIGVEQLRRWWNIWLLHTTGALILMYIRPEYLLSFALFAIFAIFTLRRTLTVPNIILAVSLTIISSLVITQVGLPSGRGRFDLAFMQHFGINGMMFNRYGPLGNADPWNDYPTFVKISFGEATTFWAVVVANPHAVAAHIGMNVVRFPVVLARTLYLTNPAGFWFVSAVAGIGLCIAIAHAKAMMAGASVSSTQPWYRRLLAVFTDRLTIDRVWIISSIGYLLPFLLSMIIVYPRIHYLGIALIWTLLALFGGIRWRPSQTTGITKQLASVQNSMFAKRHQSRMTLHSLAKWLWLPLYGSIVLIFYPNPVNHYAYSDGSKPGYRVIREVQSIDVPPSHIGVVQDYGVSSGLKALLLDSLQSPESQKLLPQLRVLIIPRSSTEPIDLTRFQLMRIENPVFQVFVERDLCRPELCSP